MANVALASALAAVLLSGCALESNLPKSNSEASRVAFDIVNASVSYLYGVGDIEELPNLVLRPASLEIWPSDLERELNIFRGLDVHPKISAFISQDFLLKNVVCDPESLTGMEVLVKKMGLSGDHISPALEIGVSEPGFSEDLLMCVVMLDCEGQSEFYILLVRENLNDGFRVNDVLIVSTT